MTDIRKRVGKRGATYQVRYASASTESGYAYKSFDTMKEARAFVESGAARRKSGARSAEVKTVAQAVDKWLDICSKEGRDGRDPVTPYTKKGYEYRAAIMKAYPWPKGFPDLETPDVVEFRSWLLKTYGRDQARRALSSFHSVVKEMASRGFIASNVAAGVSIRADSRYKELVAIPAPGEVLEMLRTADRLANSKNNQIASAWA